MFKKIVRYIMAYYNQGLLYISYIICSIVFIPTWMIISKVDILYLIFSHLRQFFLRLRDKYMRSNRKVYQF